MDLFSFLDKRSCLYGLKAKTKDKVLREITDLACKSKRLEGIDPSLVYQKLSERESQGSTGFGNEIAIPHARIEQMNDFLVFIAVSRRGVEFDAMDKKKVKLFFIILGPADQANEHLKILASISRTVSQTNVKNELLKSPTSVALYEGFLRHIASADKGQSQLRKHKLLCLILYIDDFLYHILEFFIEEGIEGATIMDSSGMGEYISNIPLFAGFLGFMQENKNRSKTILALIPEDRITDIVQGIEAIIGDLNTKQGAMVLVLDISLSKGTMKMM